MSKYDWIDDILRQLSANCGEEYHLLHSDKQDFTTTNARMSFFEQKAKKEIIKKLDGVDSYDRGYNSEYIAGRRSKEQPHDS